MPPVSGAARRLILQPWTMGLVAALWSALIGLLLAAAPMLVIWLGSIESGPLESLRLGGLLWLVANGAAISIAGVTVTLLPWGFMLIPLALLGYSGAWAARRSRAHDPGRVLLLVLPGAVLYAALGAVITVVTFEPSSRVDLLNGVLGPLVLALVGLGGGALKGSGLLGDGRIPEVILVPVRAGLLALSVIVGLGAVAATVSLVLHIDDAITMTQALNAGLGGGIGLVVLGLGYVPVLVTWGAAYLLGAGVWLGPDVTLSPFLAAGAPVALPPFPLLAALPGQAPPMAWLLPIVGVLAGVLAGLLIGRRLRQEPRLVRMAGAGAAAFIAGAGGALMAWLSAGALGTSALSSIGPDPAVVAVLAIVLVSIGAVPAALAPRPPARPALQVAQPDVPPTSVEALAPEVLPQDSVLDESTGVEVGSVPGDGTDR